MSTVSTKAGWRLTYMGRLMSSHGATLRDAHEHFADIKSLYGIDYSAEPQRQADEESKLFGFAWNDWSPTKPEDAVMPLKCHPAEKRPLRSNA